MNRMPSIPVAPLLVLLAALLAAGPAAADLPEHAADANADRADVPDVYKWNLEQLFASPAAWEAELAALDHEMAGLAAYRGRLADPRAARECLDLYFGLHDRASHVTQYANLALQTALTDQQLQARQQRSLGLMNDLMAASGFIRGELLALDDRAMQRMYADPQGPGAYRDYLENLRRRRGRVLGAEAERVLQLLGDNLWAEIDLNELPSPLETAFGALLSDIPWPMVHDESGEEIQLALSNLSRLRASADRAVRAEAMTSFLATLRQFEHVLAATLGGQFQLDVAFARARGYDTALEAYLDKDGLDVAVHDNLIAAVNANLEPLHRYVALRRQVLGLDEIRIHDLYVPMVAAAEMDVPYRRAMEILPVALAPLGERYVAALAEGLDPRYGWIDVYPSRGKASGAFSASVYGRHPYVKMNYQDSLDDLSTLAHEFGHALHSKLAMEGQPYHNYRYVPFLAEIASTCNEALLSDHLAAIAPDAAARAGILAAELESIRTTIYRQTLFSEFERLGHGFVEQGVPVTSGLLEETYRDLVARYYGPGFTLGEDDGLEWAFIPHFYYKYYVYSYATGLSCGLALAEKVKAEGRPAVDAYLGMLAGGCSAPPLDLLRGAGIDLTRPDAIEAALARFDHTLTQLAALLDVDLD